MRQAAAVSLDDYVSEKDFQQTVMELARALGWMAFHPFDSRKSEPGFPDLTLVRPPFVLFAELKTAKGRLTANQKAWGEALQLCPWVSYFVWRPADWPDIVRILEGRT